MVVVNARPMLSTKSNNRDLGMNNTFSITDCANPTWWNDNYCDDINNNLVCNWDGGDCCNPSANFVATYCTVCECLDPNSPNFGNNYG